MIRLVFITFFFGLPVCADFIAATTIIRPRQVISASDLKIMPGEMANSFLDEAEIIGKESKLLISPGRPILKNYLVEPALIERNEFVEIIYISNGLSIKAEGRTLSRGAVGDRVRVMNIESRSTVFGIVTADGKISIQ